MSAARNNDGLVTLYGAGLCAAAPIGMSAFFSGEIAAELHLGAAGQGLIVSIFAIAGAALGWFTGALIARWNLHSVLFAGLMLLAVTSLLTSWAPTAGWFFSVRIVASIGFISVVTVLPVMLSRLPGSRSRTALALWGAYLPLGAAVGTLLATLIAAAGGSWRSSFTLLALLSFALLMLNATREQAGVARDDVLNEAASRLEPAALGYALGFAAFAAMFIGFAATLPNLLRQAAGLPAAQAGTAVSFILTLGALSSVLAMWIRRRWRSPLVGFVVGFAGAGAASISMYRSGAGSAEILIAALVMIITSNLVPCLVFAYLPSVAGSAQQASLLSGLLTQSGNLGSLVGAPLISWWIAAFGWPRAWIAYLILCALGLSCLLLPAARIGAVRAESARLSA